MFVWVFVVPYCVGFVAFAFWWRLWLLLPATAVGAFLFALESDSISKADGPGVFMAEAAFIFLSVGGVSGVLASALIIIGRRANFVILRPTFVLPLLCVLGFGSYFAWATLE